MVPSPQIFLRSTPVTHRVLVVRATEWSGEDEPGVSGPLLPRSSQRAVSPRLTAMCAGRLSTGRRSFDTSVSHSAPAGGLGKHTAGGVKYGLKLSLLALTPLRSPSFSTTNVENATFLQG